MQRVLVICLALGTPAVVAACGSDGENEEPRSPKAAARQPSDAKRARPQRRHPATRRPSARRRTERKRAGRKQAQKPDTTPRGDGRPSQQGGDGSQQGGDGSQEGGDGSSGQPRETQGGKPRKRRGGARAEQRLERHLRKSFGGGSGPKATWYDSIEAVEVRDGTTTLRTDLGDAGASRVAFEICRSVIGSLPGITDVVRVTGPPGDRTLAKCVP